MSARTDPRMRCRCCRRWMRFSPTEKTPARRRPAPNAGVCIACKPGILELRWTKRCASRGCNAVDALAGVVAP